MPEISAEHPGGQNICPICKNPLADGDHSNCNIYDEAVEVAADPIQEEEWRKKFTETFTPEEIESALERAKKFQPEPSVEEKFLPQDIIIAAEFLLRDLQRSKEANALIEDLSEPQQTIAKNLPHNTFDPPGKTRFDKIMFSNGIRQDVDQLKQGGKEPDVIYFGSNNDLELAMLTGAEKISLVDPALSPERISNLVERIKKSYDTDVEYDPDSNEITFSFDEASYHIKIFPKSMQDFNESEQGKADIVMMFNPEPSMAKDEVEKALRKKGSYYSNLELDDTGFSFDSLPERRIR